MRVVAVLVALAACNGDVDKETDTGTADGPTFTRVKSEVLSSCSPVCHTGATSAPLVIPEGGEHDALVNAESTDAPGQILVVPGDANASYLVAKIEGAVGIVGAPMPPPLGALPPEKIQLVRDWIDAGAADD